MSGNWGTVALSEVAALSMGETLLSKNLTGDGVPVFSANTDDGPWGYTSNNRRCLRRGDIVIGARGSIGYPRHPDFDAFTCTQTTIAVEPNRSVVDSEYLHHALCAADILGIASQQAVPMLTIGALAPLEIALPPLDEQRRIAEVLRSVDEAIAVADVVEADAVKALTRIRDALILEPRYERATLAEATAKGLFTDGDWVESKDQDPDGEVRLIQLADVGDGSFIDKSKRYLTMEKAHQLRCTFLKEGDLLLARMPDPLGRCCLFPLLEQPCVTVVDVCVIRAGPLTSNRYLAHALATSEFRQQVLACASGTTRTRVSRGNLGRLEFPMPTLQEQEAIADVLDQLQVVANRQKGASDNLRTVKHSLMSDLLSGRVRVPA